MAPRPLSHPGDPFANEQALQLQAWLQLGAQQAAANVQVRQLQAWVQLVARLLLLGWGKWMEDTWLQSPSQGNGRVAEVVALVEGSVSTTSPAACSCQRTEEQGTGGAAAFWRMQEGECPHRCP